MQREEGDGPVAGGGGRGGWGEVALLPVWLVLDGEMHVAFACFETLGRRDFAVGDEGWDGVLGPEGEAGDVGFCEADFDEGVSV